MKRILLLLIVLLGCNKSDDLVVKDVTENNSLQTSSSIYLDENGITIKAKESAEVGDEVFLNGEKYTIVDEEILRGMVNDGVDLSKIITSKVYNMRTLFEGKIINGDISHWDVSYVDMMDKMFMDTDFNQDISNWDTSNVYRFAMMFQNSTFNRDISNWDVTKSGNTLEGSPHDNWGVGRVIYTGMFKNSLFNQDISNWDVSWSGAMNEMFKGASRFNQDLSSWVVSQVGNCDDFWVEATAWVLPKPNFIISQYCNPGYRYDYIITDESIFVGSYKKEPVLSGWDEVEIIKPNENLIWQNAAGANWNLEIIDNQLWAPASSPYGEQKLGVIFKDDGSVSHIFFNNQKFDKLD